MTGGKRISESAVNLKKNSSRKLNYIFPLLVPKKKEKEKEKFIGYIEIDKVRLAIVCYLQEVGGGE